MLGSGFALEAFDVEAADIDCRRMTQHQIAQDLADGRTHQESVAGETGGVDETRHAGSFADQRIVVRRGLVTSAGDSDVEQRWEAMGHASPTTSSQSGRIGASGGLLRVSHRQQRTLGGK